MVLNDNVKHYKHYIDARLFLLLIEKKWLKIITCGSKKMYVKQSWSCQ